MVIFLSAEGILNLTRLNILFYKYNQVV